MSDTAAGSAALPPSLIDQAAEIVAQCESAEVSGAVPNATHASVHMAALLFLGDTTAARHLWRRYRSTTLRAALEPWWQIGAAMIEYKIEEAWSGLEQLSKSQSAPFSVYAEEIAGAYRHHLLGAWMASKQTPPASYAPLLGFQSAAALQEYCAQGSSAKSGGTSITDRVAFLETFTTTL